ncbi:hypothetical protein Csa_019143 [Cucumis sativus]|nr:hypothetical protein Csa_019143 [Cucumis sativus]
MVQDQLKMHGDLILEAVKRLSEEVRLSLGGKYREGNGQGTTTRKLYTELNQRRPLALAKFEAWKMWHEDGLSIQRIAVSIFFFQLFEVFEKKRLMKTNIATWQFVSLFTH